MCLQSRLNDKLDMTLSVFTGLYNSKKALDMFTQQRLRSACVCGLVWSVSGTWTSIEHPIDLMVRAQLYFCQTFLSVVAQVL